MVCLFSFDLVKVISSSLLLGSQLHPQSEQYPLADRIKKRRPPGDSNTEGLLQFLVLMLCLDPGERATLQTLLEHPWLAQNRD
jgi:serine/threonine protein kinase